MIDRVFGLSLACYLGQRGWLHGSAGFILHQRRVTRGVATGSRYGIRHAVELYVRQWVVVVPRHRDVAHAGVHSDGGGQAGERVQDNPCVPHREGDVCDVPADTGRECPHTQTHTLTHTRIHTRTYTHTTHIHTRTHTKHTHTASRRAADSQTTFAHCEAKYRPKAIAPPPPAVARLGVIPGKNLAQAQAPSGRGDKQPLHLGGVGGDAADGDAAHHFSRL